ncbi:MAG: hypothetical protein SPK09_04050 [Porphyromonas sp.]|nr:hypothetical protein [Porphyromonas sp.]
MKILITAFDLYGKSPYGSALTLGKALSERLGYPLEIIPVSYKRADETIRELVERYQPELLLMLGQAGADRELRIEHIAINMRDVNLPDIDGYTACKEVIDDSLPMALFAQGDIAAMRDAVRAVGLRAKRSNSAGLFVCNSTFFRALALEREYPQMQTIFVHLPKLPEQQEYFPDHFVMPLEDMILGVETIINYHIAAFSKV